MKRYGLLGEKLTHSFSPQIHSLLGDYEYLLYEVALPDLDRFMRENDLAGFNVTIPYKRAVVPYCDELSAKALTIGSVNTIVRRTDGSLYGDNTDYFGFLYLLARSGLDVQGKKALVLGSGGAARTIRAVLSDMAADPVVVVSRQGENNYVNIDRHHDDAELIVNATPVGMYPHPGVSPLDLYYFTKGPVVLDLIYNPARTELLLQAEELGLGYRNGLSMLVAQAAKASELFQDQKISDAEITRITEIISRKMENIVLIGMPGCGKTVIGKELAVMTNRTFYDTDELIVKEAGKTIPEIFADDGEQAFRDVETQVLTKVARQSSAVIATGGGIVTHPRNQKLIRQNSIAVFLERDIQLLPQEGRPLSLMGNIQDMYAKRLPLYREWSDYIYPSLEIAATAAKIKEDLSL